MRQYVLVRRLKVHAANAISGPLTYGLPSITAFLGFGHALQRHLSLQLPHDYHQNFRVHGVGVVTHQIDVLDHQEKFERTLRITANPLDEKGSRPSFIEEGRCHLSVSLVFEVSGITREADFEEDAAHAIYSRMKLAGGDILDVPQIELAADNRDAVRRLMPGYVLLDRRPLLEEQMESQDDGADALDALHRIIAIHSSSKTHVDATGQETVQWSRFRRQPGWIVPIAVGYQALTRIEDTANARDPDTPHRFAEAVTSVGEFMLASRLDSLADMIWRYRIDGDLYLAAQDPRAIESSMSTTVSEQE